MKVFISWSGTTSKLVALELRGWLPLVIQALKPWMSDRDIGAGTRSISAISRELEQAHFGILCLAPDNTTAPWLHFEAGALSKQVESSRVVPYLLGLKFTDLVGPMSQFQAKHADRAHTWELVQELNAGIDDPIPTERLSETFDAMWPKLEAKLKTISEREEMPKTKERSPESMLEEMLLLLRDTRSREEHYPARRVRDFRKPLPALAPNLDHLSFISEQVKNYTNADGMGYRVTEVGYTVFINDQHNADVVVEHLDEIQTAYRSKFGTDQSITIALPNGDMVTRP